MKDLDFEITNKTKGNPPQLPFFDIKKKVFGAKYDLSLVLIGSTRSRRLNKTFREKDKPANVLSFPLSKNEGEIFIDLREAKKQAPSFDLTYKQFVALLFIHGMFHLKGLQHGGKMERREKETLRYFKI